jgi:hypothetical protein
MDNGIRIFMTTATKKNQLIGEWLQGLLENLLDDHNEPYFKKVLLGYDVNQIKTFGDGVLATCYVTGAEYADTFGIHNRPVYIKSTIAFIIKGNDTAKYSKAIEIYDLLQAQLESNPDWQKLILLNPQKNVVRDTDVLNTYLTLSPTCKRLDILGFFELRHHVFK